MSDVGSPFEYYFRVFSNFEFSASGIFALNHTVAFMGAITGLFVAGLSLLIFRSGSKDLKNQAIGMILLIEGFMAFTLAFYWIYPFSLEGLQSVVWLRAVSGITGLTRMMMMVALVSFFIETEWAKRIRHVFEWRRIWILPVISFLFLLYPTFTLGIDGAIGDMAHIYCADASTQGVGNTVFGAGTWLHACLPRDVRCNVSSYLCEYQHRSIHITDCSDHEFTIGFCCDFYGAPGSKSCPDGRERIQP